MWNIIKQSHSRVIEIQDREKKNGTEAICEVIINDNFTKVRKELRGSRNSRKSQAAKCKENHT